jgi:hypothetical protein
MRDLRRRESATGETYLARHRRAQLTVRMGKTLLSEAPESLRHLRDLAA